MKSFVVSFQRTTAEPDIGLLKVEKNGQFPIDPKYNKDGNPWYCFRRLLDCINIRK